MHLRRQFVLPARRYEVELRLQRVAHVPHGSLPDVREVVVPFDVRDVFVRVTDGVLARVGEVVALLERDLAHVHDAFDAPRLLSWGDAMGERSYSLAANDSGTVRFTMREKIGGPVFPLFAWMIPSFDASFDRFAADLKRAAEAKRR